MIELERNLKATAPLAPDGSSGGRPRDEDPPRSGLDLGAMLDMGLESLLMHFRRRPDPQERPREETVAPSKRDSD